jgi:FtsP/CotA-like multicopper oxidase with cupredoxin domain
LKLPSITTAIRQLYHPFHLHGYHMHLVGMGQQPVGSTVMTVALAQEMSRLDTLVRMPAHNVPPIKDTISIPSRGYAIVRFIADNPGYWLMHCHYEWHLGMGMGLILQVGDQSDMMKPPRNFQTCGNYQPGIVSTVMGRAQNEL